MILMIVIRFRQPLHQELHAASQTLVRQRLKSFLQNYKIFLAFISVFFFYDA